MQVATKPTASCMSATLNKAATLELIQLDDKAATESGLDNCDNEAGGDATPSNNIDTHGGHRTLPPGAESDVGAEGVDQALDVGQFGQPRLSAVDELHAREGGVAVDFRVDNPLANSRDAGAAVAAGHRTLAKHDSSFRSREAAYDEYDGSPLRWCTGCRHWSNWYGVSLIVCVSQYPSC